MAIRIQQYNTPPRRIQARGIDPGFSNPLIRDAGRNGTADVVDAMLKAGMQITEVGIREYVKSETARVSQSLLNLQSELSAERDRYMTQNKGQNALNAGEYFKSFADEAMQRHLEDGQFSGRFRQMFMSQAVGAGLHFTEQGQTYGRQQKEAWEGSVLKGDLAEFERQVAQNYNNPEWINFNLQGLRQRIETMRPGMDNRALYQELDSLVSKSRLTGLIADGRYDEAERLLGGGGAGGKFSGNLPEDVAALAQKEAAAQGVDPALVMAVIAQESGGRQDAVSRAGARGLMQLMPDTARELGVNPDDAGENVRGGVAYLKQMLKRYNGNRELALMAYNGGPGRVDAWLKSGGTLPEETSNYAPAVLRRMEGEAAGSSLFALSPADRMKYQLSIEAGKRRIEEARKKQEKTAMAAEVQNIVDSMGDLDADSRTVGVYNLIDMEPDARRRKEMRSLAEDQLTFLKKKEDARNAAAGRALAEKVKDMSPLERSAYFQENGGSQEAINNAVKILSTGMMTDPVAMSQAKSAIAAGEDVDEVLAKYPTTINARDAEELRSFSADKARKSAHRRLTAWFDEMALKSGLDKKNDEDAQFLAESKTVWIEMIENGAFKTVEDQKNWIWERLAKRVNPGGWLGIWDQSVSPRKARDKADAYIPEVPPWEAENIRRQLVRNRGVSNPTPKQIQEVYDAQRKQGQGRSKEITPLTPIYW